MTKALVVPFHPGTFEQNNLYRVYEKAWMSCWEKIRDQFDKVYIIDHGWGFSTKDPKIEVIKVEKSHWDNLKEVLPKVKEDIVGITDCDTLIYSPKVIENIFEEMEKGAEMVSIMDGSGGVDLTERYPKLTANNERAERRRFAPYLCFIKNDILKKTSYDFAPYNPGTEDWRDSFGKWSEELLDLDVVFTELPDDRTTLRLFEDGVIERDTWLDGPGYKWSMPLGTKKRYGYYHLRNFTLATGLVHGYANEGTTPYEEAMRSLGWLWVLTERFDPSNLSLIQSVLDKHRVMKDSWENYIAEMKDYHSWVTEL